MTIGPDNLGNGSTTQERFAGQIAGGYRGTRRDGALVSDGGLDVDHPRNGSSDLGSVMDRTPGIPSLDLTDLEDPTYGGGWFDGTSGSIADHPLLRGLLLELPPKGTVLSADWLDRWFEAVRSILELLYVQEARH